MKTYCTLFDQHYLAKGLALHHSLQSHAQPYHLYILAMDDDAFWLLQTLELPNVTVIPHLVFETALNLQRIRESRSWLEYCWTCASQLLWYVIKSRGLNMVTYLDADLYFFSSPEPIFDELGSGSIAIIPHRFYRGNARLLINGVYNVGWLTIRNDQTGMACLSYWASQCRDWCYHRNEDGKFADQGYLDSWPYDYGSACRVIQNIGAGTAPWNAIRYDVFSREGVRVLNEGREDGITIYEGLIFYHFHEFTHDAQGNPTRLTRHPIRPDHKRLIYGPYIDAIRAMSAKLNEAKAQRQAHLTTLRQQGDRA